MVISPKFRGFICTTAHPSGCAYGVQEQVDYVIKQKPVNGPKRVLVIGSSKGYGLASRIVAAFGSCAATIGVAYENPASGNRTASPGWYNTAAFEEAAHKAGYYAKSINGDAFSNEIKNKTIKMIKDDIGQVDLIVYSLAAPRRTHPTTGETFSSVLKPIGTSFTSKTVDFHSSHVTDITIEPADETEIKNTIAVMGGEDWEMWIDALDEAGVLADGAITLAYSYLGPELTHAIYKDGTIGKAKDDLDATSRKLNERLTKTGGKAFISVNKAVVTQSSSAIPVVPLYISLLFKVMKEKGLHENCIEQMYRLFAERLYSGTTPVDSNGRIRIDDLEMREDVQKEVLSLWEKVTSENIGQLADLEEFRNDFFKIFGFNFDNVDYSEDVDANIIIPSME